MSIIEEPIKKFISIKNKLKNTDISELSEREQKTILFILNDKKNKNSNISIFSSNLIKDRKNINKHNITESNNETKIKEKNKFFTQKYKDIKVIKNHQQKVLSPKTKNEILISNKNNSIIGTKNLLNLNHNHNNSDYANNDIISDSYGANINLLNIAIGDVKPQEIQKYFEEERNEEGNKKSIEVDNNDQENKENELDKKKIMSDNEMEEDSDFEDEQIEPNKEKNKSSNKNDYFKFSSFINKKESGINLAENFNIFDETNMINDNDSNNGDNSENEFNYSVNNSDEQKNNNIDNNSFKDNKVKQKEIEKKREEIITPIKGKENKNNENEIYNISGSQSLKICIPTEENNELDFLKDNKSYQIKPYKNHIKNEFKNKNNEKFLEKKRKIKENHINPIRKSSLTSKSDNSVNISNKNYLSKINKKVIIDDDEDEFLEKNIKNDKNESNNLILSSYKTKDESKNNNKEPIMKNEGNKFTLILDTDIKINNNKKSSLSSMDNVTSLKNNSSSKKNLIPSKKIELNNNESLENKNKNNNLINKIGSQNDLNKNINNNDNYDILCINNIQKILKQMEDKLSKENFDKEIIKQCFETIETIRNQNNKLIQRKKNIYLGTLKILQILFSKLNENKICKNYNNEICLILEYVQNFYKNVKKYDVSINNNQFYKKRKLAFKYVFSQLELKNFENNSIKDLIYKNNNNEENNVNNTSNNSLKFVKTFKRYIKTSEFLLKELKEFREQMNKSPKTIYTENFLKKYESCPANIQTSPHFMTYNRLFNHSSIILSFYSDLKKFNNELKIIEESKKKEGNRVSEDKERGKSIQINRNGYIHKDKDKIKDKTVNKEREKEKEKYKDKIKNK